jgi:hypothetical protein
MKPMIRKLYTQIVFYMSSPSWCNLRLFNPKQEGTHIISFKTSQFQIRATGVISLLAFWGYAKSHKKLRQL